jgi:Tfp pilus assembly protein PilO
LNPVLTWHLAGVATLILVVMILGVRLCLDWTLADASAGRVLDERKTEVSNLAAKVTPIRGLDQRVSMTRKQIQSFYAERIPASYSILATRIGKLGMDSGVRLSGIQYTQGSPGIDLTEISMEAGVSGDYSEIMHFVNGLERDQIFLVIRAMALAGQQGGDVNLRLRVSTWLRPADAAASGLPVAHAADGAPRTDSSMGRTNGHADQGRS